MHQKKIIASQFGQRGKLERKEQRAEKKGTRKDKGVPINPRTKYGIDPIHAVQREQGGTGAPNIISSLGEMLEKVSKLSLSETLYILS
jgi:hypothetical protein